MGLWGDTEEELYARAIEQPLGAKVEQALALIKSLEGQAIQLNSQGFYVAFSGGKDSIVLERLFKMAGVRYVTYYNNVTIDPPELVHFIRREYPEVLWNNVGKPLPLMMGDHAHGPPTRRRRWCCKIYKEQGGVGYFRAVGVRAEESKRRRGLWQKQVMFKPDRGWFLCPLLYWTAKDVWEFIRGEGMAYCCLYDEGFSRLGCIGCPVASCKQRLREFERWPRYEKLWRLGFQRFWDKFHDVPRIRDGEERVIFRGFKSPDEMFEWWLTGEWDSEEAECQIWLI